MEDQLQTPPPTADSQSPQTLLTSMHSSRKLAFFSRVESFLTDDPDD